MSFERGKWLVGEKYSSTSTILWKYFTLRKYEAYSLIKNLIKMNTNTIKQYYVGYGIYINGVCVKIKSMEEVKICSNCKKIIEYDEPYQKIQNMYFHKKDCEGD